MHQHTLDRCQNLPNPFGAAESAMIAERNICAHFQCDLSHRTGINFSIQSVQGAQNRRGVRTSSAKSRLRRNPFNDPDVRPVSCQCGVVLRSLPHRIIIREQHSAGSHGDVRRLFHRHRIIQTDRLHQHIKLVIAVCPFTADPKRQIDLCECFFLHFFHNL